MPTPLRLNYSRKHCYALLLHARTLPALLPQLGWWSHLRCCPDGECRYIVVHESFYPSFKLRQTHQILQALFGEPKRYDDGVVVYKAASDLVEKIHESILEDNAFRMYALAFLWFAILSAALTWYMVMHPTEVIVGGGELGGWFWRQWWHYSEVKALEQEDFGLWGTIESLIRLGRFRKQGKYSGHIISHVSASRMVGSRS